MSILVAAARHGYRRNNRTAGSALCAAACLQQAHQARRPNRIAGPLTDNQVGSTGGGPQGTSPETHVRKAYVPEGYRRSSAAGA